MSEPPAVTFGASSHVGLVREVNEDSLLTDPPLFAVADGMGGHDGGDLASQIVVEELTAVPHTPYSAVSGAQAILEALRAAQQRLLAYGATHRGSDGRRWRGGTTAVVALLVEHEETPHWLLANLGDSRIYTFHDGRLDRVSTDHSVVQELIDSGMITEEEALVHPERHIVTRALGGPEDVDPDIFVLPVADAGRVLLCSDGINGMVPDAEIAAVLAAHADPVGAADGLVEAALAAGGVDNATAVVIDAVPGGAR
jgi:serine/threonine protein phosphatase PrpC